MSCSSSSPYAHVKGGAGEGGSGPYPLNSEGRCRNESAVVCACTRRAERAIDDPEAGPPRDPGAGRVEDYTLKREGR
jgi:hypothetical protein